MSSNIRSIFGEDDSETGFKMEIDMAVEEPRTGVVSLEPNGDVITSTTSTDDIANNGVVEVINGASCTTNDSKVMTVQVERMRPSKDTTRHAQLDNAIRVEGDDTSNGKKVLGIRLTADDLKEDRSGGRDERGTVDKEVGAVEGEEKVDMVDVGTIWLVTTGNARVVEWVEVCFEKRVARCRGSSRGRVLVGCTGVTKDSRVDTTGEGSTSTVGLGSNPVVVDGLVGVEHEGIPLSSEDLDRVNRQRLRIDTISFDDRHSMSVNAKLIVRVTRNADKSEPVAFTALDRDDGQTTLGGISKLTTFSVDQGSIGDSGADDLLCESVVPVGQSDHGRIVIDVVQTGLRVVGIVHNERATKTVAVLGGQMAVIPERSCLIRNIEVIQERVPCNDWALSDEGRPVGPSSSLLEEAVPVDGSGLEHGLLGQLVDDVELEVVTLLASDESTREGTPSENHIASEAIGRDVVVGNGEVGDRSNRSQGSRNEPQGYNCDQRRECSNSAHVYPRV